MGDSPFAVKYIIIIIMNSGQTAMYREIDPENSEDNDCFRIH